MKKGVVFVLIFFMGGCAGGYMSHRGFLLKSAEIHHRGTIKPEQVFSGFGCTGQNISPSLAWENVPPGTKSFALSAYDPDAPTGSGWWHWVVYNIPSEVRSLPAGAGDGNKNLLPSGAVLGNTDYGTPSYGGPCPPEGDKPHRYIFTLHALKVEKMELPASATAALVGFMVNHNTIEKTSFTGYYGRPKP